MSETKLISPMLDGFAIGGAISEHHGISCYPAMPKNSDKRYIVKVISIPASQVQLDALLLAGAYTSKDSALAYFKELADGVSAEADILKKLSRFEGFIPFDDLQIVPKDDDTGYDVYLLSTYKRSLDRHMKKKPMTHLNAVNLGLDLCASMVVSRRMGYLYVDLKPSNIYINEKQEFRIGDLGFVKLDSLKYSSLPDKYRSAYTAPEISDAWSSLNDTLDTYAVGMILYQVYNDGKLPFEGQAGTEELPPPLYADYEMAEIILKAIDPNPELRWTDPMLMGQALVAYMQRNSVNDVPIVPLPDSTPKTPMPAPVEEPVAAEEPTPVEEPVAAEEPVPTEEANAPESVDEVPEVQSDVEEPVTAEDADEEILPALVMEEDITIEAPAEEAVKEEVLIPKDELTDLSFMDSMVSDDTTPNADTAETVEYDELSDETSDMLSLADELIAMEMPEPVVAPEPIDIPIPAPIVLEDAPEEIPEDVVPVTEDPISEETVNEVSEQIEETGEEVTEEASEEVLIDSTEEAPEEDEEVPEKPAKRPFPVVKIVAAALVLLLLIGGILGSHYYYNNFYLQTVDSLHLEGDGNNLVVYVDSDVDETLLTVVCTDTYGTTRQEAVKDGKAIFENLDPDTIYQINVVIDGFHELKGDIADDYSTPAQTEITRFDAIAANETGSVVLNFAIDGKDSDSWTVTYSAEEEEVNTVTFAGHFITINGLTPNKEYTFTLTGEDSMYIVGNNTVTFTAALPVYAENLDIPSCDQNGLVVVWTAPEGATVQTWTVRCYNESGYDKTVTTADLTYTFTDIDLTQGYTVEVIAEGMSVGVRDYVSANCATITAFHSDPSIPMELTVSWEYTGNAPAGGWLVLYKLQGTEQQNVIQTTETTVTLTNALPGGTYEFQIQATGGTTVYGETYVCSASNVEIFSGYGVTAENISVYMVRTPSVPNWTRYDLVWDDYSTSHAPGDKVSLLLQLHKTYNISDDLITALFVVRDESGELVCSSSCESSWTYMWSESYCELDIPKMPTEPGNYFLNIYFNNKAISQIEFTIE